MSSTIHVHKDHSLGVDGARTALERFEGDLAKRGARLIWSGSSAEIKGPGVSGSVELSASTVDVRIRLGLLARAAGVQPAKLEASIGRRLDDALAG